MTLPPVSLKAMRKNQRSYSIFARAQQPARHVVSDLKFPNADAIKWRGIRIHTLGRGRKGLIVA
ncbi:hypothetical protein MESS2_1480065 [Mesorhizobium metallidurans STM 2683]|uniref:Uncharacterized protein n=1 Tax=Mesorhizobium metallidurans STM 2683 TaxID=1297569 RepID=M5EJU4_9HYPH|nr:hypothetical protein [Mesorhizobium metallidurans]CCV05019.1 hypothetical protein MESS2_1480065 [Mesorhizobium metallidurans STM 2683]